MPALVPLYDSCDVLAVASLFTTQQLGLAT